MKNNLFIITISLLFLYSCSKEDPNAENEVPTIPILLSPANNSLVDGVNVTFSWEGSSDPEGEEISYNLQLSDEADFTHIIFSDELNENGYTTELTKGKYYYWRVRAKDASNNTSEFSPRQNFVVRDELTSNYAPFAPEKRFPDLDEAIDIDQAKLGWTCFDVDDTDLEYNIYLGTEYGNLPLYVEGINTTEVTLNLDDGSVFYWQVEVTDPSGQTAISPIWWFKSS
ncbi:fibronectin type III domain-containing protein [Robertkochia flava]|uniref:hypothetical protein n=1 Tax=Robertkochia flava TaxID=3447986 RepID=UPI001CCB5C83|nr:hypothetical protein [Robertkochia marina]